MKPLTRGRALSIWSWQWLLPRLASITIALITALLISHQFITSVEADPITPSREQIVEVEETAYHWWLNDWQENELLCELTIYHDGLPTRLEILEQCGSDHYQDWLDTPSCETADVSECRGSYMHFIGTSEVHRTISIELPTASANLALEDCAPSSSEFTCHGQPTLTVFGEEPLPNESIVGIEGTFAGLSFSCQGTSCRVPLRPSGSEGFPLVFWARSSYGDTSKAYSAKVRVIAQSPDNWQVNVLSDRLRTSRAPSCALNWGSLPPTEALPTWLQSVNSAEMLATDIMYAQLANQLVRQGIISTFHCPNFGFHASGALNACGLEAARTSVIDWQNQFDLELYSVAQERNVPSRLLKAIFAQESQFWPGIYASHPNEAGLGKLTAAGADTPLLWNQTFFQEFCPLVLAQAKCNFGYPSLDTEDQALLRGALFNKADASCPTCPQGIDLRRANTSVEVFAETLLGSCDQVGQMIRNTAKATPGEVSSYLDLWKMTIASYHAGPGCLANAIGDSWLSRDQLTWKSVALSLEPGCQSALDYVNKITRQ